LIAFGYRRTAFSFLREPSIRQLADSCKIQTLFLPQSIRNSKKRGFLKLQILFLVACLSALHCVPCGFPFHELGTISQKLSMPAAQIDITEEVIAFMELEE